MSNTALLLAIDQGTTSSRAILFNSNGHQLRSAQREIQQYYPEDGFVEHDANEIWNTTLDVCQELLTGLTTAETPKAIGITNQRETVVLWERDSGKPICRAIVWQDRRTAAYCRKLAKQGLEATIREKTGLLLDPYFSATKLNWLLDNIEGAREKAEKGALAFGTVDSFLIWKLNGGRLHATDATNASRTLLFNIHTQTWDEDLLKIFQIPAALLPEVKDSIDDFGVTEQSLFSAKIPIRGVAGDQQASLIGQACFEPGMVKSTYGTGCFVMLNTGKQAVVSNNKLLTTVAYRINGEVTYALEGSIFVAGAAIQWLRDGLSIIDNAHQSEALAASLSSNRGVYLVPAFTGLGAPHWDPEARAAIFGLTRDSGKADLARAALESIAYQTRDLLVAMESDSQRNIQSIRVDGGMVANHWLLNFLSGITQLTVVQPQNSETTALGAAYLAGIGVGVLNSLDEIKKNWEIAETYQSIIQSNQRRSLISSWEKAVQATRLFSQA